MRAIKFLRDLRLKFKREARGLKFKSKISKQGLRLLKFKSEILKGAVAVRNTCAQQTAQNLDGRSGATQAASNLNRPRRRRTDIPPYRSEI